MNTLADSTLSWKANLTTMAMPEQVLTLRANIDASYEAGYRDGSINYELEHCPACKNVADLQAALDENAKLRELVAKYSAVAKYLCELAKYLCEFSRCNECNLDCASVFNDVPSGWDCARMLLDKEARELGIEVQ